MTRYGAPGYAFCVHKRVQAEGSQPLFRVPRMTSVTDKRAAVRTLGNTYMRMCDNSSFEHHALQEMVYFARLVQSKCGYTKTMTLQAWTVMAGNDRYVHFARRHEKEFRKLNEC